MKTFKVIEEGRLSKDEMKSVTGGVTCRGKEYVVTANCMPETKSYSQCGGGFLGGRYTSCGEGDLLNCSGSYSGPTGPGGNEVALPGEEVADGGEACVGIFNL